MQKIMVKLRNVKLSIAFLFRPITPLAVSFGCLFISVALLVFTLLNLEANTKVYEVLLAILTGVTASLLIAIMMELYNNYRFNVKRQRELREYFRQVASYEMNIDSVKRTDAKHCSELGSGRAYAVFCRLNKIIPCIREALDHRDYLYRTEIEAIDDILSDYDDVVKSIWMFMLDTFMELISFEVEGEEVSTPAHSETAANHEPDIVAESIDDELIYESINNYPSLLAFLKQEARRYHKKGLHFDQEAPYELEAIIENAIFHDRQIFSRYFEITDSRYESAKNMDAEEQPENELPDKIKNFEFRSSMISRACGDIDKAMTKLQRRVAKEPYFWVMASYTGKKR